MENIVTEVESALTNAEHAVATDIKGVEIDAARLVGYVTGFLNRETHACTRAVVAEYTAIKDDVERSKVVEELDALIGKLKPAKLMTDVKTSPAANYLTREETEALRGIASRAWHRFVEFI